MPSYSKNRNYSRYKLDYRHPLQENENNNKIKTTATFDDLLKGYNESSHKVNIKTYNSIKSQFRKLRSKFC
jgi:hypothetical protein